MVFSDKKTAPRRPSFIDALVSIAFRLNGLFGQDEAEETAPTENTDVSIAFRLNGLFGLLAEHKRLGGVVSKVSIAFRLNGLFGQVRCLPRRHLR